MLHGLLARPVLHGVLAGTHFNEGDADVAATPSATLRGRRRRRAAKGELRPCIHLHTASCPVDRLNQPSSFSIAAPAC